MISDLDDTIKNLLVTKGAFKASQVDIKFEAPDREWSASISKPTINIYLYDIRENHQLRGTDWIITKDTNGNTTKKRNPSRIDVSYLITVWSNDVDDEHRLLWNVMATLFRYPELPDDILTGDLVSHTYPLRTTTAQPDGLFSNPSDFWSALDNKIKASINYVVTLTLDSDIAFTAPMVRTRTLGVKPINEQTETENIVQISGVILKAGKPELGMHEATVLAKEAGSISEISDKGTYTFPNIQAGKHTFRVIAEGKVIKDITVTVPSGNYDLEIAK
jgi:hypothetical protein